MLHKGKDAYILQIISVMAVTVKMKAAVFHGPFDIRVEDVEVPEVPSGWILVRVKACGICGSDVHMYKGTSPELKEFKIDLKRGCKGVFGHESAGEVIQVGEGVEDLKKGDRVSLCPLWGCGKCVYCRTGQFHLCPDQSVIGYTHVGAYSEYTAVPAEVAYLLPNDVSYEIGAFMDPVSCGIHAVNKVTVTPADVVAVVGAGTLGLSTAVVAKAYGARKVIVVDLLESPLKVAEKMGVDETVNASETDPVQEVMRLTDEVGADAVIEAVGGDAPTIQQAIRMARKGGRISYIGIFSTPQQLDLWRMLFNEVTIRPSWSFSYHGQHHECEMAHQLICSRKVSVEPMITHKFPLTDIKNGFVTAIDKTSGSIKVLVLPTQ